MSKTLTPGPFLVEWSSGSGHLTWSFDKGMRVVSVEKGDAAYVLEVVAH